MPKKRGWGQRLSTPDCFSVCWRLRLACLRRGTAHWAVQPWPCFTAVPSRQLPPSSTQYGCKEETSVPRSKPYLVVSTLPAGSPADTRSSVATRPGTNDKTAMNAVLVRPNMWVPLRPDECFRKHKVCSDTIYLVRCKPFPLLVTEKILTHQNEVTVV